MIANHRNPEELQWGHQAAQCYNWRAGHTGVTLADIHHDLGGTFDVDLHAGALQSFDDNAHTSQGGDKFKHTHNAQLQKMGMLNHNDH